ncbi:outer membrane lipoprotein-sorting protein [candidate division KSB1 bacterium]|nr:outer membrane lipoprotein-sorting protein [candidate division KSB1 bacterium]
MKLFRILPGLMLIVSIPVFGQGLTGEQIINKVNDIMNQETIHATMQMTIQTTSGEKRSFEYESWSKDRGEKNLVRYIKPARVKGFAILMLNNANDIWSYFPRTQRVRKLATHAKKQKMQNSDFTYEDMGSGDSFIKDFTAKRLDDEKFEDDDCYVLDLTKKKDADTHYSRIKMYVIKENFVPVAVDYFHEDDPKRHTKRLVQSDIREIDGVPTGMKMVMTNLEDNSQTEMKILKCEYNVALENSMFTERELKK